MYMTRHLSPLVSMVAVDFAFRGHPGEGINAAQCFGHDGIEELTLEIDPTMIVVTENKESGLLGCQRNLCFQSTVSCQ